MWLLFFLKGMQVFGKGARVTLTKERSSESTFEMTALGSSHSCGCSKGCPALLISHAASVQNMKNCSPGLVGSAK